MPTATPKPPIGQPLTSTSTIALAQMTTIHKSVIAHLGALCGTNRSRKRFIARSHCTPSKTADQGQTWTALIDSVSANNLRGICQLKDSTGKVIDQQAGEKSFAECFAQAKQNGVVQ